MGTRYLKQNTDSYVTVGPAIDKTAGLGNEDGLTVTSFAGVIVKEVQSSACTHTDFTPSATAANDWGMAAIGHGGLYQLKIPDSEINFVGSAKLAIWYDAEALPFWEEFMVVPANVWDSLMGTDLLDVNTSTIDTTAAATVKTQAVAALNTDTYAEPGQGTPAATTTLVGKIGYLYKAWRNRCTQSTTQYSLFGDDAATVDQKATFSDTGTADRGEIASGP